MLRGLWISAGKFLTLAVACLPIAMNEGALGKATAADPPPGSLVNCDIQRGPCTQERAGMPGMEMGPNRVELRPVKDHVYEGEGVIVRCPSGRRTWKATLTLPESGKVEFVFDVIS